MALPGIFSPQEPQGGETVASGPAKLTANFQYLADVLGLTITPTPATAAAFQITAGGVVTILQSGALLTADPTSAFGITSKQYADALGVGIGVASGTNTYAVTLAPVPTSLPAMLGKPIVVQFTNANTGASTLAANGFAATPIMKWQSGVMTALVSGDISALSETLLVYDGTQFELLAPTPVSATNALQIYDRSVGNPATDVVNTAAETGIYSKSVAGGTLGTDGALRVRFYGDLLNNTGGNQNVRLRGKFGGTTVLDTGNISVSASASVRTVIGEMLVSMGGATNIETVTGRIVIGNAVANGSMIAVGITGNDLTGNYTGLAIDTTTAQTLQVTVQLGTGSPTMEFRSWAVFVEQVQP